MNKIRKIIYFILLIILMSIVAVRLGFFDSKTIKVDNITIKKPFLYRNINDNTKIQLDNYDSAIIVFFGIFDKKALMYNITKIIDKEKFKFKFELHSKIDMLDDVCYLLEEDEVINLDDTNKKLLLKKFRIYKYPYYINYNEKNSYRSELIINQICKDSKIKRL